MKRLVCIAFFFFVGCTPKGPDQALLAALGVAQALHHEADELDAQGDHTGAIRRVEDVLTIAFPPGAPEREDVRLDAHGRIAELYLGEGDADEAEKAARAGLGESTCASYFRARLHIVLGRVHSTRAQTLREHGDQAGARRESERSMREFEESIAINREVLGLAPDGGR